MDKLLEYKGYYGTVEFSLEDQVLHGKVIGINGLLSYEGETIRELENDFHDVIDEYLADCKANNLVPQKSYKGVLSALMAPSPHSTGQYDVIIADEEGEYACYSGMWWVPQNRLAYMEPLCTIPRYRGMGLASAALSKHYSTLKPLGATHMTGGCSPFYEKIGYGKGIHWYCWKRPDIPS